MRTRMQALKNLYTGLEDPVEEARQADWLGLPWWLRGPVDEDIDVFKGQPKRKDGTFRAAGGFLGKTKDIFNASSGLFKFNYANPGGQPLHVCVPIQLFAIYGACSGVFSCVHTQLFVCVRIQFCAKGLRVRTRLFVCVRIQLCAKGWRL